MLRDLRYACRSLGAAPWLTAVIVLSESLIADPGSLIKDAGFRMRDSG
jgi:hypothetical protein